MTHYKYSILEKKEKGASLIFYHFVDESELDFLKKELKRFETDTHTHKIN